MELVTAGHSQGLTGLTEGLKISLMKSMGLTGLTGLTGINLKRVVIRFMTHDSKEIPLYVKPFKPFKPLYNLLEIKGDFV